MIHIFYHLDRITERPNCNYYLQCFQSKRLKLDSIYYIATFIDIPTMYMKLLIRLFKISYFSAQFCT
jgi:hypothetical protein